MSTAVLIGKPKVESLARRVLGLLFPRSGPARLCLKFQGGRVVAVTLDAVRVPPKGDAAVAGDLDELVRAAGDLTGSPTPEYGEVWLALNGDGLERIGRTDTFRVEDPAGAGGRRDDD